MLVSIQCTKKRLHFCLKILLIVSIIGIYFIVLLRESFAAWESSSLSTVPMTSAAVKNSINGNGNYLGDEKHYTMNRLQYKRYNHHKFGQTGVSNKSIISAMGKAATQNLPSIPSTTVNPIYEYSEEKVAVAEADFTTRRDHLWKMCTKYNMIDQYPPNAWEFFISMGHGSGIAWCNIFKAASSTWMYYFNILGGYDVQFLQRTKASPLELARKRFPRPSATELNEALSSSLSFLIVREPFERLLSGYRNKLESRRNKYYKLLGDQIIKDFRKGNKRKPPGPTFTEFILFLIDNYKKGQRFDEHFSPYYSFCTPCTINYTLIAKVETLQRDTEYIIRQSGLETLLLNKMPFGKKIRSISNESTHQTAKLINKYFSKLDDVMLRDLLKIYGPDFDLFGYNSTKYFDIVKSSKPPITPNVTTIATAISPPCSKLK
ncbi:carbohydrate sulfotransferase 11 [Contarinia nasturtii]|uniref:carbohydrate sulfotransferase 11 n=1 Tax=Contarinia nasturtii TaxID=265458 RepID=UPI0012D39B85|nr:carbohydrate sulfotransferase 11 [Contarinia nasturtii]XP_031622901.1 carbohydrate sulfotransferase 11 [Contarinia nasturtii]